MRDQGRHDVADVGEATGLLAVAEDGQRLAAQRLADQVRHDHAVPAGLPGPTVLNSRTIDPADRLAPVGVGERLVDALRRGVGPPRLQRRAEDAVRLLGQAVRGVLAVDLAGRGQQQARRRRRESLEDDLGAVDVGAQALQRVIDDQVDADGGREVEYPVGAARRRRRPRRGQGYCPRRTAIGDCPGCLQVGQPPVDRLSSTTTSSPESSRCSTRWLPIKPAPPVITVRIALLSLRWCRLRAGEIPPAALVVCGRPVSTGGR